MTALLEITGLTAGYGPRSVLRDVSLTVNSGEIVTVLGPNGAGKTTLLRAIAGQIRAKGCISFEGSDLLAKRPDQRAWSGIGHVPEGRGTLVDLTVADNLRLGGYVLSGRGAIEAAMQRCFSIFPRLAERQRQVAGGLSGGEQQMLAIARALISSPKLLLLDEPSTGLAPRITGEVFDELRRIRDEFATTILLVEQNARRALRIADRAYLLEAGGVSSVESTGQAGDEAVIRRVYLGG